MRTLKFMLQAASLSLRPASMFDASVYLFMTMPSFFFSVVRAVLGVGRNFVFTRLIRVLDADANSDPTVVADCHVPLTVSGLGLT